MEAGDWISMFMALIATASAVITYVVYRASTDPEVIVYADIDKRRPSIMNLVVKNIGNGPASDITFKTSRPLPNRAFSIAIPEQMPDTMSNGPIVSGVPYLAPRQELVITFGQIGGLKKYFGDSSITITSKCYRQKKLRPCRASITSQSKINITQFEQCDISDQNWDKRIAEALKTTNKELKEIKDIYQKRVS